MGVDWLGGFILGSLSALAAAGAILCCIRRPRYRVRVVCPLPPKEREKTIKCFEECFDECVMRATA